MNKLDGIEARYSREGEIEVAQIADDLGLLVRAVRQLGTERMAYQSLFEATDDLSENDRLAWPELARAYDEVSETPEPDTDVMGLLK